jgi:WD40 repeat protein
VFDDDRTSFDARGAVFVTRRANAVFAWDARTLKLLAGPRQHHGLEAFVISGDGRTVLTYDERECRLWDVATSTVRSVVRPNRGELKFAEISPDGSRVLTVDVGDPLYVNLWRADEGRLERQLHHRGKFLITSAQFDPPGTRVMSYRSSDGSFKIQRSSDGFDVGSPIETNKEYCYPYVGKFDPRGGQYAIPKFEGFLIVDCETAARSISSRYQNQGIYPAHLHLSADGSRIGVALTTAGGMYECQSYSADTGKFQRSFAPGMKICRLFGPGGKFAICAPYSNEAGRNAELWDIDAGKLVQEVGEGWPVDVSPDGKTILRRTRDGRTSVWRLSE